MKGQQFRMRHLQVYNWGTFSDLHEIPIAEEGYLFVGPSGAGKSTLLDAFTALLIPPRWLNFNAAARESERGRDRNLLSYVRGAWAAQKDDESGEIVTRYLRPSTTWSGLALTFVRGETEVVTLAQLLWVRGSSHEVRRLFLVFERSFRLTEVAHFDLDVRRLKAHLPEAMIRDEFPPYRERFCRLLGIHNEQALRLLHKTQSAKNLGDLNAFMREYMLEKPETFAAAERLVQEFVELDQAHQAVVTARQQVEMLLPCRDWQAQRQEAELEEQRLRHLLEGLDDFRDELRLGLLQRALDEGELQTQGLQQERERHQQSLEQADSRVLDLQEQHRQAGGGQIERWEEQKAELERQRGSVAQKRHSAEQACLKLGWTLPENPQDFAQLKHQARHELEDWQTSLERDRSQILQWNQKLSDLERLFGETRRELEALQKQPSNLPAEKIELRYRLATELGLHPEVLPFAGELLEVKKSEAEWRPAIERVLHGLALTMLVEEKYYSAVSSWVNHNHLGQRLVYQRQGRVEASRRLTPGHLPTKVQVKPGVWANWLEADLRARFDYACVESMAAFQRAEGLALTRQGQVKHARGRHEKNDRQNLQDRRFWFLGFSNAEKLNLYREQALKLTEEMEEARGRLEALKQAENLRHQRSQYCRTVADLLWEDLDLVPLVERIAQLQSQLEEARRGNARLQDLARQLEAARQSRKQKQAQLTEAETALKIQQQQMERWKVEVFGLQSSERCLSQAQRTGLESRFTEATLENLGTQATRVERKLRSEREALTARIAELEREMLLVFHRFNTTWKIESADLQPTLECASEYLALLRRLEVDNLPAYEDRFFQLLREQSHQNLAALNTHLNQGRKQILDRMEDVNESLRQVQFNPGTYLEIRPRDLSLEPVRAFRQDLQAVLSDAFKPDREGVEQRFLLLRALVQRLASATPEDKRWRELVLDVRLHVEFLGREFNQEGVEIELYQSGAGKSGGQRQKLATTCLAAALRYQLVQDGGWPSYAAVILDEAFDKADNEFTALAMKIFVHFGFQMIVATPLKAVQTLEPFIGGACFVDIRDRNRSSTWLIEYDQEQKRLKLPKAAALAAP